MLYSIRKDKLKQAGFFYLFYFLAMILGVLVGLLFDRSGNMFYAPAFTAFFGGVLFIFYTEKIKTFGLISGLGCLLGLFFLLSRHGFGAFLPGLICGVLADLIARSGSYQRSMKLVFLPEERLRLISSKSCLNQNPAQSFGLQPAFYWALYLEPCQVGRFLKLDFPDQLRSKYHRKYN